VTFALDLLHVETVNCDASPRVTEVIHWEQIEHDVPVGLPFSFSFRDSEEDIDSSQTTPSCGETAADPSLMSFSRRRRIGEWRVPVSPALPLGLTLSPNGRWLVRWEAEHVAMIQLPPPEASEDARKRGSAIGVERYRQPTSSSSSFPRVALFSPDSTWVLVYVRLDPTGERPLLWALPSSEISVDDDDVVTAWPLADDSMLNISVASEWSPSGKHLAMVSQEGSEM
jgi:hypothetical protein